MSEHQLLSLTDFTILLEAQYAASSTDPAGNPARRALLNAIIALAARQKTDAGLSDIPRIFYQNATAALPELILQEPSVLSVQALLAMAIYARNFSDSQAFVMSVANSSRQLETLDSKTTAVFKGDAAEQYRHLCRVAIMLRNDSSV